jgi:hypothetical protein
LVLELFGDGILTPIFSSRQDRQLEDMRGHAVGLSRITACLAFHDELVVRIIQKPSQSAGLKGDVGKRYLAKFEICQNLVRKF